MAASETTPQPAVAGIADTRATRLDQLASGGQRAAVASLRHVLPTEEPERLTVCAFASSI
jgi:hypothetical protein